MGDKLKYRRLRGPDAWKPLLDVAIDSAYRLEVRPLVEEVMAACRKISLRAPGYVEMPPKTGQAKGDKVPVMSGDPLARVDAHLGCLFALRRAFAGVVHPARSRLDQGFRVEVKPVIRRPYAACHDFGFYVHLEFSCAQNSQYRNVAFSGRPMTPG